jgi:sugar phosphate isomerase/epimerase
MIASWPLGISTGCCHEAPLADVLPSLVEGGVERIEIGTPGSHFDLSDTMQAWRIAECVAQFPLRVLSVHAPFGTARDLASEEASRRHAGIRAALAAARTLIGHPGAIVVVHPSDLPRDAGNTGTRLGHALESLLHIDYACRELGVRLAVETPLPHLVGGNPIDMTWLLDRLPAGVGMCLDTGHAHLGRFIKPFIDLAGDRLMHVHVHDNRGTRDDHLIPGEGHVDWCELFDGLRRVGYGGALILELSCPQPSADYFRKALAGLRRACGAHAPHLLSEWSPL